MTSYALGVLIAKPAPDLKSAGQIACHESGNGVSQPMEQTKIERILCPVDFSDFSVLAFAYASSVARHFHAKLFAQHVVELGQYPSLDFVQNADAYDEFCATLLSESKARLRAFIQAYRKYEVDTECITSKGMAANRILSFAKEHAVSFIVMGTHGLRGFERLMMGSVTEKVLRMAQCPVLAVPELPSEFVASATSGEEIKLQQIVACTDFSESSYKALDYGISVAEEYHANLTLVHVLEDVSPPGCVEDVVTAYKRLDGLIPTQTKLSSRITTGVRIGRAYREISQFARDTHADLVVMAVRGRNSLDDAIFGSTTYRVIQSGVCPVLAIHKTSA
jgi:nucleotide-binding universal stress UspA family protein